MAVAYGEIFSDVESERRVITVPTNTAPRTALLFGGRPMVTITGSGDHEKETTITAGDTEIVITQSNSGGVGLGPLQATATPNGTWGFDVTGASAATAPGTAVYITSGGVLTLTSSGNTLFGIVDFFRGEYSATDTAVTIGVNLG